MTRAVHIDRGEIVITGDPDLTVESIIPSILGHGMIDPYPLYEQLREARPIYRDPRGVWLVSSHALIARILLNTDRAFQTKLASQYPSCLKHMLLMQNDASHDRLRKLLTPLFSAEALSDLKASISQDVIHLLEPLECLPRFNLVDIALALPVRTICRMLGIAPEDAPVWFRAAMPTMQLMGSMFLADTERARLERGTQQFADRLETYIDSIDREAMPDHPISRLLQLEAQGQISGPEIVGNCLFLFVTGVSTTTISIGNVIALALKDRNIWRGWCADRASIRPAIRELMRYDTAAHAIIRHATRDIELDGQRISRGDRIWLLLGSGNRDPHEFGRADEIDPNRKEGRPLTFGLGAHACIGRMLAITQIEILAEALVDCMPALEIDETHSKRHQIGWVHGYPALWLNNTLHESTSGGDRND